MAQKANLEDEIGSKALKAKTELKKDIATLQRNKDYRKENSQNRRARGKWKIQYLQ
jgi:F0F1-type ATP synthase epsilon subunit